MKPSLRVFILILLGYIGNMGNNVSSFALETEKKGYAFIGVNIIPMDRERVLENQTLIVQEGKITYIGDVATSSIPDGIKKIEAKGKYLLPGLSDMHAHTFAENNLLLYLATGVTTLRNLSGNEIVLDIISKLNSGEILGPEFYSASPLLEGENYVWDHSTKITDPNDADQLIKGFKDIGYYAVKIYHTISKEVHEAVVKAGVKYNIPIVGHVPFEVKVEGSLNAKQSSIEHLRGYDIDGLSMETLAKDGGRSAERFGSWLNMSDERMDELVNATLEAETWNIPTFVVVELLYDKQARQDIASHPDLRLIPPANRAGLLSSSLDDIFSDASKDALRESMPQMYKIIKKMNDIGAGLMTGTDTMVPYIIPGFSLIDEIEHFIEAGLSPYDALKASTSAPAEFLGESDNFGTVSVGKSANLILVEGNPLEDVLNLWNLEGVSIKGQWLDRKKLDQLLEEQAASYEEVEEGK